MTNQALPQRSRQMVENYLDRCQNLGLILDKFAPWGHDPRGNWDLVMRSTIRRQGQNQIQTLSGGEAKGLWLSTQRRAKQGESPSLFEVSRTDTALMAAQQNRWLNMVRDAAGVAFTMETSERLVAGLGASHVLETALTLDRNTGLPYLPGSTVKGLARAWGLIEVADKLNISLDDTDREGKPVLNTIAELLISEPNAKLRDALEKWCAVSKDAAVYIEWFRFIFGCQEEAAAVCFLDAIFAGDNAPVYAADVMTPHYVNYYTENGGQPPAEDDNPNPVSFITVDTGNKFAFGLIPRRAAYLAFEPDEQEKRLATATDTTIDWLSQALTQLGAGSKTASGYGFFSRRSFNVVVGR